MDDLSVRYIYDLSVRYVYDLSTRLVHNVWAVLYVYDVL
jgi:hypothetical protein